MILLLWNHPWGLSCYGLLKTYWFYIFLARSTIQFYIHRFFLKICHFSLINILLLLENDNIRIMEVISSATTEMPRFFYLFIFSFLFKNDIFNFKSYIYLVKIIWSRVRNNRPRNVCVNFNILASLLIIPFLLDTYCVVEFLILTSSFCEFDNSCIIYNMLRVV